MTRTSKHPVTGDEASFSMIGTITAGMASIDADDMPYGRAASARRAA